MLLSTVCSKPSIPDEFLRDLRPIKRRPTFGNWPRILEGTTSKSRSEELRLFRQLPSFVFHELLPGLKGGARAPADKGLIEVRNILVLGGTMKKRKRNQILEYGILVGGIWRENVIS